MNNHVMIIAVPEGSTPAQTAEKASRILGNDLQLVSGSGEEIVVEPISLDYDEVDAERVRQALKVDVRIEFRRRIADAEKMSENEARS